MISPICFLFQYNNKLELKMNSLKYGHDIMCWHPDGKPEETKIMLVLNERLVISDLEPNTTYCFYTLSSTEKKRSPTMKIQVFHETIEEYIDKILNYAEEIEDEETAEKFKRFLFYENILYDYEWSMQNFLPNVVLQRFLNSIENPENKEIKTCCQIMQIIERYMNMQNIVMNRNTEVPLQIEYGSRIKLRFLYSINKISVYTLKGRNKKLYKTYRVKNSEWIELEMPSNEMYLISCYAQNDLVYSFFHYQFDENMSSYLWNNEKENFEKLENAMQNNFIVGNISLELNDQELEFYLKEISVNPRNYIDSRPQFAGIAKNKINFHIDCWDFIKASNKKFYIAAKEEDLLLVPNSENLVLIESEYVSMDYVSRLIDGNTLFYIVDEKRNPVTKMTRYSFYDTDEAIIEEYNQKIHDIEFDEYEERITKFVKRQIPEALNVIKTHLIDIRSNENVQTEKIWLELIRRINKTHQSFDKFVLFYAIMEEQNTHFNYDLSFFENPISYFQGGDIFAFPTRKDPYIVVTMMMNEFSDDIIFQYARPENTTTDIQTREYDYYFMYGIDLQDYRRSGFIMFEKGKIYLDRIFKCNIDIKDVV